MREPREHLKTLQRRVDFLKSRDHKNSFDQAELGSLEWALVNLQTKRKPLTLDDVWFDDEMMKLNAVLGIPMDYFMRVIRAVEVAHGIKENT